MQMYNFNSGPSILPEYVLRKAAEAITDFKKTGLSILEIGHRTTAFIDTLQEARQLAKELMQLGPDYEVLYLQGGATTQFMQVPMNLLGASDTAAYCDNGIWGTKAIKEAEIWGNVNVVSSTKDKNYSYIEKVFAIPDAVNYLHITTNNTVEGTQWHTIPGTGQTPLIADMSSDIFSRPLDFSRFSLIYAGAQKNAGAAGTTLVIVNKNILGRINRNIPPIMDYRKHIEAGSLLNTAPVFAVYVSYLTLKWIKEEGGLEEMHKRTKQRAELVYAALDSLDIFTPIAAKEDRSLMNVTFTIENKNWEEEFLELCKEHGMVGVKGYRTVGGLRVSLYNAMPVSSVVKFTELMSMFNDRKKNAN